MIESYFWRINSRIIIILIIFFANKILKPLVVLIFMYLCTYIVIFVCVVLSGSLVLSIFYLHNNFLNKTTLNRDYYDNTIHTYILGMCSSSAMWLCSLLLSLRVKPASMEMKYSKKSRDSISLSSDLRFKEEDLMR